MNLIIAGLRRSGTTVFWEAFRADKSFVAYDEPLNPRLVMLPQEHRKGTHREYIDLIDNDAEKFWASFAPISPAEELQSGLTADQKSYMAYLTSGTNPLAIDTTRCHFKVADLASLIPKSLFIHLHREPSAFTSSHLLPSGPRLRRRVRLAARKRTFWSLSDGYDHWGYQTIIGDRASSTFGQRLAETGIDAEQVYTLPAAGRLLALWRVFYEEVESAGLEHFGERFVSLPFELFATRPGAVMDLVYRLLEAPRPPVDFSRVHPLSRGYRPDDPRWQTMYPSTGLSEPTVRQVRIGGDPVTLV